MATTNPLLFDVATVPLTGKNLIEASAGTGKTYSLAMLALRFIVEQGLPVRELLMVTFTEKAVAELQLRIRLFIKQAHAYSENPTVSTDPTIRTIVDQQPNAAQYLTKAMRELDELYISTIHSFCQQTLNEFAFQTGESFNRELLPDLTAYTEQFIYTYIRENLYTLPLEKMEGILALCREIVATDYYQHVLAQRKLTKIQCYDDLIMYYQTHFDDPKLLDKITQLSNNDEAKYIYDLFHQLANDVRLDEILKEANVFSFDDLVLNLNQNTTPELIALLATKYSVLFIDEFQDTDSLQYNLFSNLFTSQTVFYIGDPKQSIYKFRNADLYSYFKAKQQVDTVYNLPINYRSTAEMVQAVNDLFDDTRFTADSNSFCFAKNNALIQYQPIKAHQQEAGVLNYNNVPVTHPFYINAFIDEVTIAKDIQSFLTYGLHKGEPIQPNQVAFIARSNQSLAAIKKALAELKVPAVIIQEQLIFETEEAYFVLHLLQAIQSRSTKDIRLVLSHRLFDIPISVLPKLEYNTYIDLFFQYSNLFGEKGVYNVLMQVYADFSLRENIKENIKNDIQFWANITQITEQLQHVQTQDRLTLEELIVKLEQRTFTDQANYQTRIESDAKSVQLLTIHKSKGLEFDYVFTSNVNTGKSTSVKGFFKYYDHGTQQYHSDLSLANIGYYNPTYQLEEEQEKRRTLYVLFTRAKYGVFAYSKQSSRKQSFDHLLHNLNSKVIGYDFEFIPCTAYYTKTTLESRVLEKVKLTVADKDWKKLSYSYLSGSYTPYLSTTTEQQHKEYDAFIFELLSKGTLTGNMIHAILERIDFNQDTYWDPIVKRSLLQFAPSKVKLYHDALLQLLHHLVTTPITLNQSTLQLKNIATTQKVAELAFNFHVNELQMSLLNELENKQVVLQYLPSEANYGMLNGLIDLVFEYEGKYYILDWKTNYLGNSLEQYNTAQLQEAMTHSNYHLQYCIYTIALVKYLQMKVPNFDYDTHFGGVIYLFVRGVRENSTTGIYTNRLSKNDIAILDQVFTNT